MRSPHSARSRSRGATTAFLVAITILGATSVLAGAPVAHAGNGGGSAAANSTGPRASTGVREAESAMAAPANALNLVATFAGIQHSAAGSSPPDVQLAVGPAEVVEMVNVMEEVFTKAGTVVSSTPLATAFNTVDDIGDPRVVYDSGSNRFFASVYDFTSLTVIIAVSKTSDVGSGWVTWSLNLNTTPQLTAYCPDNPFLGVAADKVIVTANDYVNGGSGSSSCRPLGTYVYQIVWVVNKQQVLQGGSIYWSYFYYDTSTYGYFGIRPVSSPTGTAYAVCTTCGNGILLEEFTGVPTASSSVTATRYYVPFGAPPDPIPAPIPGSTDVIDTGDQRIVSTAWGNGIWLAFDDRCVPAGDNTMRSCARVVQISVASNQVVGTQDVYGAPGTYLFYPAVAIDSYGGVGLVAGYSSSGAYPGLLVTGVRAGEGLGDLVGNEVTVTAGTGYGCDYYRGSSNACRYGDYFGAATDPADPTLMWFAGEYATSGDWGTSVAAVRAGFAAVTLSYSTQDGSAAPGGPQVTYTYNGANQVATLTSAPTTYYMDIGTSWSAGTQLGGTASERWVASGTPGGAVTGDATDDVVYYHQYQVTPSFTVVGGGSISAPSVSCTLFGTSATASVGTPTWADAGSPCSYQQSVSGPSSVERWAAGTAGVNAGSAGTITEAYYHQYQATLSYSVNGGGAPPSPELAATELGGATTISLTTSPSGYWIDAGSAWSVSGTLFGSAGERWVTGSTLGGTAAAGFAEALAYQHQYYLSMVAGQSQGGSVPRSGWLDSGSTVSLIATTTTGWQFEGWAGIGSSSYTGSSASTTFALDGPVNETATFYPGLTVTVSGSGSVTYSYGGTQGTVSSGTPIFVPAGTTVTLTETPSSFLYSFGGWGGGSLTGSASPQQIQVSAPTTAAANFGYNITSILGIVGGIAAVIVVSVVALRRGHRLPPPPPGWT